MSYMHVHCELCLSTTNLVFPIDGSHSLICAKVLQILKVQVKVLPRLCCQICMVQLLSINNFIERISYVNPKVVSYTNKAMQTDPTEPDDTKEKVKHEYNCSCSDCQEKYGGLPLLVEVIEGQHKLSLPETQPTNSDEKVDQPVPSTSTGCSGRVMKCPYCDKTFSHKGDMNKHIRKHTKEQPYSCSICHKKFAHTSNLSRHLLVHSGHRPFQCQTCGKSFSRKDKLQSHRNTKICKKFQSNSS